MAYKWIKNDKGKIHRGGSTPPDGDIHLVSETGSVAIIGDKVYIDGKLSKGKKHAFELDGETLDLDVDAGGKIKVRGVRKHGK